MLRSPGAGAGERGIFRAAEEHGSRVGPERQLQEAPLWAVAAGAVNDFGRRRRRRHGEKA